MIVAHTSYFNKKTKHDSDIYCQFSVTLMPLALCLPLMSRKCCCSPSLHDHISWLWPLYPASSIQPPPPEPHFIHRNMFCSARCSMGQSQAEILISDWFHHSSIYCDLSHNILHHTTYPRLGNTISIHLVYKEPYIMNVRLADIYLCNEIHDSHSSERY